MATGTVSGETNLSGTSLRNKTKTIKSTSAIDCTIGKHKIGVLNNSR
jgi:stage III sporulation protein SpoIIIAA